MATSGGSSRADVPANHLTRSRSTANSRGRTTMAQTDGAAAIPDGSSYYYCTLPRPSAKVLPPYEPTDECETGPRVDLQSSTGADVDPKAMGNTQTIQQRLSAGCDPAVDQAEARRSLLYEQNMCTFENFCERRNSQQRLQSVDTTPSDPGRRDLLVEAEVDESADGLGNFCTLRRPSRRQEMALSTDDDGTTARYCTLKRKKLQLNRKFVESFLEDPNAKVADYLSELDAYLDEIDDVEDEDDASDVTSVSVVQNEEVEPSVSVNGSEDGEHHGPHASSADDGGVHSQSLQYYQAQHGSGDGGKIEVATDDGPQDNRIQYGDIKHFCTLPKQKRTQVLSAFKRGASLRRTFVAPAPPTTSTASEAEGTFGAAAAAAAPSAETLSAITDVHSFLTKRIVWMESTVTGVAASEDDGAIGGLSEEAIELENLRLALAESEATLAALEALVAKQPKQAPLRYEQLAAFFHGWVRKCETATAKARFRRQTIARQIAHYRGLVEQKREYAGSETLRVQLEGFELERTIGERDLQATLATSRELRFRGAEAKRNVQLERRALYAAMQQHARLLQDVDREQALGRQLSAKIEQTEREVSELQKENERLRRSVRRQNGIAELRPNSEAGAG
uniref:Uncharacterized protein n=1 Tax=Anopheles albimanus TaxID=7167 RepID=A0A182FU46_ANOAL